MNRMMKDMVSIIEVGCGVVWDCVVDTSTQVYRIFKNDNKSHVNTSNVNKSKLNHGINPMQDPNGLSRLTTGSYTNDYTNDYTKAGCSTPGNVNDSNDEISYDSNQNEDEDGVDSKGIEDEDGVDENDWRDRFTGWLP
jgi:hypothetical protein